MIFGMEKEQAPRYILPPLDLEQFLNSPEILFTMFI